MKKITFEEYLQEIHAEDYHGCDDDMPDDFAEWLSNRDDETLKEDFEVYITSEYVTDNINDKYIEFIRDLTQ